MYTLNSVAASPIPERDSQDDLSGREIRGNMGFGRHRMTTKVWLNEGQLNVRVLSKMFGLDSTTVMLKSEDDNRLVAPMSSGNFALQALDQNTIWVCEGEPDHKRHSFNGYASMKTVGLAALDFSLFLTHLGMLISLFVYERSTDSRLEIVTIICLALCIFVEMAMLVVLYLVGVTNVDEGDGQETVVCFKSTLRFWNRSITVMGAVLITLTVIVIVTFLV